MALNKEAYSIVFFKIIIFTRSNFAYNILNSIFYIVTFDGFYDPVKFFALK